MPSLSGLEQLLDGEEVTIPPAVVEDEDTASGLARDGEQGSGLRGRNGHRLIDDDVFAGAQALLGHRHVRIVGGRDNDDVQSGLREHRVERWVYRHIRVCLLCGVTAALDDTA